MTAPARPQRRPAPPVTAADRLQPRTRHEGRGRRALRRTRNAVVVLVPVATLSWVVLGSTWLAVDRVDVSGTGRLSAAAVTAAAGIEPGTPLARVDTGTVEDRVAALAPVADVAVRRTWPGTLTVEVTERTPVAGVLAGGAVTLVDADGVPFAQERALPPGLVQLDVAAAGPDDAATLAALAVHADLPEPLRARVRAVKAPSPAAVVLLLRDGRQIVWGGEGGTATKAAAALALLGKPGTVFDVSAEGVVVVSSPNG